MPAIANRHELLRNRLDRFTRMLPGIGEGDVPAVHHARVASRRLRELLPILQLESSVAEKLGHRLRRVTRRLGRVRELDVLLQVTEELRQSDRHLERSLRRVAEDVRQDRDEARAKLTGKRMTGELRRVARKLEKIGHQVEKSESAPRGAQAWRWVIAARVARRASTTKSAIDHAGALYLQERLHAVRIAIKKLRYALELDVEMAGNGAADDLKVLKRGQTTLGRMHDLEVLIGRVRRVQNRLTSSDSVTTRDLDTLLIALDRSCRRLHGRYVRDRVRLLDISRRLAARTIPQLKPSKVVRMNGVRRAG